MAVLGFETSTPVCSVALADADRVLGEYTLELGGHHSERLLPMSERLLQDAGIGISELEGVSVASGPGSFTGLRIGMSTAKGLCLALDFPLLPIPTLAGMAFQVAYDGMPVCAMLDARRGEVYAGVYRLEGRRLLSVAADAAVSMEDLLPCLPRPVLFVGDGAQVHRSRILSSLDSDAFFVPRPFSHPTAASIALLGAVKLNEGATVDACLAEPCYLRRTQAERAREDKG